MCVCVCVCGGGGAISERGRDAEAERHVYIYTPHTSPVNVLTYQVQGNIRVLGEVTDHESDKQLVLSLRFTLHSLKALVGHAQTDHTILWLRYRYKERLSESCVCVREREAAKQEHSELGDGEMHVVTKDKCFLESKPFCLWVRVTLTLHYYIELDWIAIGRLTVRAPPASRIVGAQFF